jgi:hypothetical protein
MKPFLLFFPLLFAFAVCAQPSVNIDTVLQTGTCAGSNILVPYNVTGGSFNFGNVFRAQLSNNFGQFNNPVNIGQLFWFSSGIIPSVIPVNTPFGFFYRVRVTASSPIDTSLQSPNTIIVTQTIQLNSIIPWPGDTICVGDTATLAVANPAVEYLWSTGDTTQFIQVTQSGQYIVTVTDILTCQTSDTVNIVFQVCSGMEENFLARNLSIFPNPSNGVLFYSWNAPSNREMNISVVDQFGRTVFRELNTVFANQTHPLDLSGFAAGLYSVLFSYGDQVLIKKIIIQ